MRILIALSAAAALLMQAGDAQAADPCRPKPRHHAVRTFAANDLVRVYKIVDTSDHVPGFVDIGEVYACDRRTGWRRRLGPDGSYPDLLTVRPVRAADRFVAYSESCTGCREHYRFPGYVSVLDMATRHHVFVFKHGERGDHATDLVLKPNGSVAWISSERLAGDDYGFVVRRHDAGGTVELDRGARIGALSLGLIGDSTLSWSHGGKRRSAPLE